jgi:hypothetical protein
MDEKRPINEAIQSQMTEIHQHINTMKRDQGKSLLWVESFMLFTMIEHLRDMVTAREMGRRVW